MKEKARTVILKSCILDAENKTLCINRKTAVEKSTAIGMTRAMQEIVPSLRGNIYVEGEEHPATRQLRECRDCKSEGSTHYKKTR
jgi:hypothetical protein